MTGSLPYSPSVGTDWNDFKGKRQAMAIGKNTIWLWYDKVVVSQGLQL
jgi:hypothetical protein